MQFTVTKEQILEFANWGNPDNKKKLKEWFPKAFEPQLEVGKWYTFKNDNLNWLMNYQGEGKGYGFNTPRKWNNDYYMSDCLYDWREATHEEVESALIAEAKKRGYKKGVTCIFGTAKEKRQLKTDDFIYENQRLMVKVTDHYDIIFKDGKWAQILPEEKTIITKGKALRIIAKKLKVSPESIEIQ